MSLEPRTRPQKKTAIKIVLNPIGMQIELFLPNAQLFHFATLCSYMHMAWMRYVRGRLKSRYRYSITIVYNNFPWPNIVNSLPKSALNVPLAQSIPAQAAPENIAYSTVGTATIKLIAKTEAAAQARARRTRRASNRFATR